MAESYSKNQFGYKSCGQCYRVINGIRFEQWTYDREEFDREKEIAKSQGLKTRIINGELYREVKSI